MNRSGYIRLFSISLVFFAGRAAVTAQTTIPARNNYKPVAAILEPFIQHEMADKQLPALSIALVDGQQIVWAQGFGFADPQAKTPAGAETAYRVGSISKLFTDIAVMQQVERGQLNLDAPIAEYLPAFHPRNPFNNQPITLRELISHRSGLLREPPVGNYFDPDQPGLAETIRKLAATTLVYPPGEHTKYSNAAVSVAGYLLQTRARKPYPEFMRDALLKPMGLNASAFEPTPEIQRSLAKGYLWTYDGRILDAPTFQLGISPAGSMYSTVLDLGHFLSILLAGGRAGGTQFLRASTLQQMWTPQFAKPGQTTGFGLGFHLSSLDGRRMIGHSGAIYGFASELEALPDANLGVVVITTMDSANAVAAHIAQQALRLALQQRGHQVLRPIPITQPVGLDTSRSLAGRYGEGDDAVDLFEHEGELLMLPLRGGYQVRLRKLGDNLIVDDKLAYGTTVQVRKDAIVIGGKVLHRVKLTRPDPVNPAWAGLIGEYGWNHDVLYILERNKKLTSLIEWYEYEPLQPLSNDRFRYPARGLYDGEDFVFTRDKRGIATQVTVGAVVFRRRAIGPAEGHVFQIHPVKPIDVLREAALKQRPPLEKGPFRKSDLVELTSLDPTIKLDIRYATSSDFLGTPLYLHAKAFMQRPAAEAVVRVQHKLRALGYGLLIHDAYRPWYVTKIFWDATPEDKHIFVADPSQGSRHNRGCAVDLTLYVLKTGKPVVTVGGYDEMSPRSYPFYPGGTSLQRWYRNLLRTAMESEGFTVYETEWWHFDYKDWRHYAIGNQTFEQLERNR